MIKLGAWASSLFAASITLVGFDCAFANDRIALVIGNSHYSESSLDLANAAKDAQDVAKSLEKVGFKVFLKTDLRLTDFKDALSEFAREAERSDMALFYYAGHGIQFKGENYFLPVDSVPRDNKDIKFRSVAMSEVVDAASYSQRIKIIILDACRNSVPDPQKKGTRSVTGIGDASGLAPIAGSDGMIVFYSAEHGHEAYDAAFGSQNSPFAASLVQRVGEPGKDVKAVFTEVTKDVMDATAKSQHPEIVTAELTTDVFLNPAASAEDAWRRIRDSRDSQVFRDFIRRYPDSELADAAQLRLDKFDAEQRHLSDEHARQEAEAKAATAAADKDALERRATAMREAQQAQADKLKAEKEATERALADKFARMEASRRAAEQQVAEELRRANEAAAEVARMAKENAAKEAEARRLADEAAKARADANAEADAEAREAARQQAEKKAQEARQAAEQAEKLEAAKQFAKLEEEAQRSRAVQQAAKAQAEACARDRSALDDLRAGENVAAVQALRSKTNCTSMGPQFDLALKEVANRQAAQCAADQKTVATLGANNIEALSNALPSLKCAEVVKAATLLVARLEESAIEHEKSCNEESVKLNAVDLFLPSARGVLQSYSASNACPAVRTAAKESLDAVDGRVKQAQGELSRLGCLTGPVSGVFDANTAIAVNEYLKARHASQQDNRITDAFVEELRRQDFKVCVAAPASAPVNRPVAKSAPGTAHASLETKPLTPSRRVLARTELVREAPKMTPNVAAPRHHVSQAQVRQPAAAPASSQIMGTGF